MYCCSNDNHQSIVPINVCFSPFDIFHFIHGTISLGFTILFENKLRKIKPTEMTEQQKYTTCFEAFYQYAWVFWITLIFSAALVYVFVSLVVLSSPRGHPKNGLSVTSVPSLGGFLGDRAFLVLHQSNIYICFTNDMGCVHEIYQYLPSYHYSFSACNIVTNAYVDFM